MQSSTTYGGRILARTPADHSMISRRRASRIAKSVGYPHADAKFGAKPSPEKSCSRNVLLKGMSRERLLSRSKVVSMCLGIQPPLLGRAIPVCFSVRSDEIGFLPWSDPAVVMGRFGSQN